MAAKHKPSDKERSDEIIAEARSGRRNREQGYRDRALKMFPWICARCGREFAGKKVRELTVHHKDHNHDNNPPDGSNWELLCLYCHENEHSRHEVAEAYDHSASGQAENSLPSKYKALADLDALLKEKKPK
jgi:hypothetical protein